MFIKNNDNSDYRNKLTALDSKNFDKLLNSLNKEVKKEPSNTSINDKTKFSNAAMDRGIDINSLNVLNRNPDNIADLLNNQQLNLITSKNNSSGNNKFSQTKIVLNSQPLIGTIKSTTNYNNMVNLFSGIQSTNSPMTHNNNNSIHIDNPPGVRAPESVFNDFPNLRILEGILKVQDYDNPEVKKLVAQLAIYPENILASLKKNGLKEIEVANLNTPDMGDNLSLKGVAPRNWPEGSTWDNVPGAYNPGTKTVVAGTASEHGSESLLIHETGHAIGDLLGFNDSSELKSAHERLFDKLNPYLKGTGESGKEVKPGNEAGRQELLAEGLAVFLQKGETEAIKRFDVQFVDFIKNKVLAATS